MATCPKLRSPNLKGRVAIITGSTRGIGRECALALARCGCGVVVAAKSTEPTPSLPGSIFTVAAEVEALGAPALPCKVDLRDASSIERCVQATLDRFGRVDIVVNNASALWWHNIEDTPIKKYDLITSINTRGAFYLTSLCLPHMLKQKWGRVVSMAPPIQTGYRHYKGMTAYNISKFGMCMVAMGVAAEGQKHGVTGNSLWPATVIESQAAKNFQLGETKNWRKADILADAVLVLVGDGSINGEQLIDDELLLRQPGVTKDDLAVYRYDPSFEPPRVLAPRRDADIDDSQQVKRGDVRKLRQDSARSTWAKL